MILFFLVSAILFNFGPINAYINLSDTECGTSESNRYGRIVGGSPAFPGQFPWMVSITRHGGHFCGGSIINKQWILTAAHCLCNDDGNILSPQQLKVTIAEHNLHDKNDGISYKMEIKSIIVHPQYSCKRVMNDVALLQVYGNIKWSNRVQPACLANSKSDSNYNIYDGYDATVAGWGWLNENTTYGRTDVLQKVKVEVISNSKCNEWYKSNGLKTRIRDTQLCAGYKDGGKDSCWADSGGPLMVGLNGKSTVIGVVSTGRGCARPQLPGLYTRLSEYLPWIQKMLKI